MVLIFIYIYIPLPTYKNGDDWGLVYEIVLPTLEGVDTPIMPLSLSMIRSARFLLARLWLDLRMQHMLFAAVLLPRITLLNNCAAGSCPKVWRGGSETGKGEPWDVTDMRPWSLIRTPLLKIVYDIWRSMKHLSGTIDTGKTAKPFSMSWVRSVQ